MKSAFWQDIAITDLNVGDDFLVVQTAEKYKTAKVVQIAVNEDESITVWVEGFEPVYFQEDDVVVVRRHLE